MESNPSWASTCWNFHKPSTCQCNDYVQFPVPIHWFSDAVGKFNPAVNQCKSKSRHSLTKIGKSPPVLTATATTGSAAAGIDWKPTIGHQVAEKRTLIASSESVKIFTDRLAGILHAQHCLQRPSCHFGTVPGVRNKAKHIDVYLSGIGWKSTPILHQLNLNQLSKANTFYLFKIANPWMNLIF